MKEFDKKVIQTQREIDELERIISIRKDELNAFKKQNLSFVKDENGEDTTFIRDAHDISEDSITFNNDNVYDDTACECNISKERGILQVTFFQSYDDDQGCYHTRSINVPACVIVEALKHFE